MPIQGEYSPIGCIKKPIISPKKQQKNPEIAPKYKPAKAEMKIVKENCTPPNLISSIFITTPSAVINAIYAIRWLLFFACIVGENSNFEKNDLILDIKKPPCKRRSAKMVERGSSYTYPPRTKADAHLYTAEKRYRFRSLSSIDNVPCDDT